MRILIDLTYINPLSISGVSTYAHRLLKGLKETETTYDFILLITENNKSYIEQEHPYFHTICLKMKDDHLRKYLHFIKGDIYKKSLNQIIKENNINLLFTPFLNTGSLFTSKTQQIGVLHDAQSFILTRNQGIKGLLFRVLTVRLLKKMTHIVTISNFAKLNILKEIPALKVPFTVVYNSVVVPNSIKRERLQNKETYILFVNTLMPYKNLETLVRAFGIIKDSIEHKLIVKAKKWRYWNDVIIPLLKEYDITDRVLLIQENYTDEEMATLYCEADLFVSPSMMEGFGYTPIEAAMHKTPVISSKDSALFETTLGLLNYYEPSDHFTNLAEVICFTLKHKPTDDDLLRIANTFKEKYSPMKQAKSFIDVFNNKMN